MEYLITFIIAFIVIWVIYMFYYVMFARRDRKKPIEAQYIIRIYGLDINKFSFRKFMKVISFTTSFDVALATMIVFYFKELVWQVLFAIIVVIPIVVISFMIVGRYYQRKQLKDNSLELEKEKRKLERQTKFENKILGVSGIFGISKKKKGNDKNDECK